MAVTFLRILGVGALLIVGVLSFRYCDLNSTMNPMKGRPSDSSSVLGSDKEGGTFVKALKKGYEATVKLAIEEQGENPRRIRVVDSCSYVPEACAPEDFRKPQEKIQCLFRNLKQYYIALECKGYQVVKNRNCYIATSKEKVTVGQKIVVDYTCVGAQLNEAPILSIAHRYLWSGGATRRGSSRGSGGGGEGGC